MKTVVIAALFALTAGAASAAEIGGKVWGEYALEAEQFDLGLVGEVYLGRTILFAEAVVAKPNGVEFDLDHVDVGLTHALTEAVDLYGKASFDHELVYTEATVGAALKF